MPTRLAIFASGSGSNAEQIVRYFRDHPEIEVTGIFSNNPRAGVLERAKRLDIPYQVFDRDYFYQSTRLLDELREKEVEWIVLAGFLWLVPTYLIEAYPQKIINIHPALLPKFGGKGMYGGRVHQAVYEAGENFSGITIHYVNEAYDEGAIIRQFSCPLDAQDQPEDIARKVQLLEHTHFPSVIEELLMNSHKNP